MKQLRFAAFLSLIVCLIVLLSPSSSAQAAQSPKSSQQTSTPTVEIEPQVTSPDAATRSTPASAPLRIRVVRVPAKKLPPIKQLPDTPLIPEGLLQRVANAAFDSQNQFDRGIFLRHGTGNTCGSIVSYNFSPGNNPQVESVTTCTPSDAVVTRNALGKDKKAPAPLFQLIDYKTPQ